MALHLDQVDDAVEVVLSADGQLENERLRAQAVDDGLDCEVEVRAHLVHLVDEADARNVVLGSLTPNLLGLRLDTLFTVEDSNCAVEHAQRPLHLDREVDVAGGVDDVDLVVVPEASHGGRRDRDAAFLLLLHPVRRRRTVVRLTDLVIDTGVEQDALGGGGLAGIDVRHDADVADLVQVSQHFLCHRFLPRSLLGFRVSALSVCSTVRAMVFQLCLCRGEPGHLRPESVAMIRPPTATSVGAPPDGSCSDALHHQR